MVDLTNMSSKELRELQEQIAIQLKKVEKREREAAIEQIYGIAHSLGLPLTAILGDMRLGAAPRKQRIKYRDPTDPSNVWVGKGPRPPWFKRALDAGVSLDLLRAA